MIEKTRDPTKAKELLQQALAHLSEGNRWGALTLLEEAIYLDPAASLNDDHVPLRAVVLLELGNPGPQRALELYNEAVKLGKYREAQELYLRAIALDTRFLWALNNLGWDLATAQDPTFWNGTQAREYAIAACEMSRWNHWGFITTLAAAYARCGLFKAAIRFQLMAMDLAEPECQEELNPQLAEFKSGKAHVDLADKVAAGGMPGSPPDASLQ